ncbi:hypothetical protein ACFO25_19625, partial [Paenactinomyces guangxiensis]|uniref:hypothetical protein n=1 Tax=Paenactinomyces guangxiensis TaxID=1490290 RepID=UPI003610249A
VICFIPYLIFKVRLFRLRSPLTAATRNNIAHTKKQCNPFFILFIWNFNILVFLRKCVRVKQKKAAKQTQRLEF